MRKLLILTLLLTYQTVGTQEPPKVERFRYSFKVDGMEVKTNKMWTEGKGKREKTFWLGTDGIYYGVRTKQIEP